MYTIMIWILAFAAIRAVVTSTSCLQDLEDDVSAMKRDIESLNKAAFPDTADECIGEFIVSGDHRRIPDLSLTASSSHSSYPPRNARLGASTCWAAGINDENQWIQADLGEVKRVYGVVTQGRANSDQWVKSYMISHSLNHGTPFTEILTRDGHGVFNGNKDRHTPVLNMFQSVQARNIRISPKTWYGYVSLRFDVIGCRA
ncbi:unnamed protein product [Owenia fusiformis]|uniref:F5/8 type C domain-containing protein n=1 Tax=Owenia fusiformis TaxID=6347 RepID=A0A8S4N4F1_OWEFU|nr:unnamed protein product [Owenia fusiformis]